MRLPEVAADVSGEAEEFGRYLAAAESPLALRELSTAWVRESTAVELRLAVSVEELPEPKRVEASWEARVDLTRLLS
jgi:hypothetical protein